MTDGEETVVIKRSSERARYHRTHDGATPACDVRDGSDPECWRTAGVGHASAWFEPCQNPGCWGDWDTAYSHGNEIADAIADGGVSDDE